MTFSEGDDDGIDGGDGGDCGDNGDNENGDGVDLTGFLFGNIDDSGHLEDDDLLDGESKRMLSSLGRMGLGSILAEVMQSGEEAADDGNERGKPNYIFIQLNVYLLSFICCRLSTEKSIGC